MNSKQIVACVIAVLGVLMISTSQLQDLFGPTVAKSIVSLAALLNSILGGILAALTGQANTIKEVAAMPGVESIKVNAQANQVLSAVAIDPAQPKVEATTSKVEETITKTAEGN